MTMIQNSQDLGSLKMGHQSRRLVLVLTLTLAKFFRFIVSAQGAVFVILLLMLGVTGYVVVNYAL